MTARTGFTVKQVTAMRVRDDNRCAWTGDTSDRLVPQHRIGRGMGGSKLANRLSNGVLLDSLINWAIEADTDMQAEAVRRGLKVSRYADPTMVPVLHAVHGWVLLGDAGEVCALTVAEAREIMHDLGIGVAA